MAASLTCTTLTERVPMRRRHSKTLVAFQCLVLGFLFSAGVGAHAEVREVSVSEVVKEFCAVIVANEVRYTELLEGCFPDASQSNETLDECVAVRSSVVQVLNAFFSLRKSTEVELHYSVPYDWEPPAEAFGRLKCKRSEGQYTSGMWSCGGLSKDEVQIASREPICAGAFEAEERIVTLSTNVRRAFQLLQIRSLRTVPAEQEPVVEPQWSISN